MNGMHDGEVFVLICFSCSVLTCICMLRPILVTADVLQLHAHQTFSAEIIISQTTPVAL